MKVNGVKIKCLRIATKGLPAQHLVKYLGEEIGLLERWRGADQPWFAYAGIGFASKLLGPFYGDDGVRQAYDAILRNANIKVQA